MKGFTLWEPWASLMAHGYKKNETRGWYTKYRGPLVIHAAKTNKHIGDFRRLLVRAGIIKSRFDAVPAGLPATASQWPFGKIVAVCNLVDCVSTNVLPGAGISKQERACGDYSSGRFVWVTEDLVKLETPIPWKGMQGFWKIPEELAAQLPQVAKV